MSQQLPPRWADPPPKPQTQRSFRIDEGAHQDARSRGGRRGTASRFALRNLPPIDEDDPLDFGGKP